MKTYMLFLTVFVVLNLAIPAQTSASTSPEELSIATEASTILNDIVDPLVTPISRSQSEISTLVFKELLSAYYHQMHGLTMPQDTSMRPVPYNLWTSATQNKALMNVGQKAFQAAGPSPTTKIERLRNSTMFLQGLIKIVKLAEQNLRLNSYQRNHVKSLMLGLTEVVKNILILDIDPTSGLQLKGAAEYLPTQRLYNVLLEDVEAKTFAGIAEMMPGRLTMRLLTALDGRLHKVLVKIGAIKCEQLIETSGISKPR